MPDHREFLRTASELLHEAVDELRTDYPTVRMIQSVSATLVRVRNQLAAAEAFMDSRAHRDREFVRRIQLAAEHGAAAWGPWSTGEQLLVGLALDDSDLLTSLGYSRSEALLRWRLEEGFDNLTAVEAWIADLRQRAGVSV